MKLNYIIPPQHEFCQPFGPDPNGCLSSPRPDAAPLKPGCRDELARGERVLFRAGRRAVSQMPTKIVVCFPGDTGLFVERRVTRMRHTMPDKRTSRSHVATAFDPLGLHEPQIRLWYSVRTRVFSGLAKRVTASSAVLPSSTNLAPRPLRAYRSLHFARAANRADARI